MKNHRSEQSIDLHTAQSLIVKTCEVLPAERIGLSEAPGRIAAQAHKALLSLPDYDGSLRDGYALGETADDDGKQSTVFQIIDEVAAGDTRQLSLAQGEAIRIMTGGLIPSACHSVIPQEKCELQGDKVQVPESFLLQGTNSFIHKKGSEIRKGELILEQGSSITEEQQVLLAGAGYESAKVIRQPKISFLCTGSELITDVKTIKHAGQRFSANNHLLAGLINRYGAILHEQETVADDPALVTKLLNRMAGNGCDILLTTGGMGPGKFDLIEEAFAKSGGQTIYRSLNMRPGKSTLFGTMGKTLFFGLPGPPPAVQLLFHELIRPAICGLQGAKQCKPQKIKATLTEEITLKKHGLLRLKSGVLTLRDGQCLVRPASRSEIANCYIFCSATRRTLRQGEKVNIHVTSFPVLSSI